MQTGVPDLWSLQGPGWYEHVYGSEEGSVSPAGAWAGQGYEGGVTRSQGGVWSGHQAQSHTPDPVLRAFGSELAHEQKWALPFRAVRLGDSFSPVERG